MPPIKERPKYKKIFEGVITPFYPVEEFRKDFSLEKSIL